MVVQQLNCRACHPSGGGAAGFDTEQDSAAGGIPDLRDAGLRLQSDWLRQFVGGQAPQKVRPWLAGRMPAFPARADVLATGLAATHGLPPAAADPFQVDLARAELGQGLVGKAAGFDCVACHQLGPHQPAAQPNAHAIDLSLTPRRLRHEYFEWLMSSPSQHPAGTRLPPLAGGGDWAAEAARQRDALWHYLQAHEGKARGSEQPAEPGGEDPPAASP